MTGATMKKAQLSPAMEKENAEYLRRLAGSDNSKGPKAHQVTDILSQIVSWLEKAR